MPTSYDDRIQQAVRDALVADQRIDSAEIGVTVHAGMVTLTGTVASWATKLAAADAAHQVGGVLDVVNDLGVALPADLTDSDPRISAAVRHALRWDAHVPDQRISSTVADGFVTLSGEVDSYAERDDAARVVRDLAGVIAVDNRIVVRVRAADTHAW